MTISNPKNSVPQQGVEPWPLANWMSVITTGLLRTPDHCHIHPFKEKGCPHAFNTLLAWSSHGPPNVIVGRSDH